MAEKQLTQEELTEIQNLQQNVQDIATQLGSIEMKKIQLNKIKSKSIKKINPNF